MSRITIDSKLITKLCVSSGTVELVDEAGRVVGHFTPAFNVLEGELSPEETQHRLADGRKRYTTDEVLNHLRELK